MSLCLHPIEIYNQSRFMPLNTRHLFKLRVRCGKCPNCQQVKAAEWYFRGYKQFEDCCNRGGFVLFDCLTYSTPDLNHLKDYPEFECLPNNYNFSCFNREDLRLFFVRLRKALASCGYDKDVFSYYVGCEYGTCESYKDRFGRVRKATHRPHYHVLFYVYANIDPLFFSRLVAKCWKKGRTDGLPYKSVAYVLSNVFRSVSFGGRKVCAYVSKYVQKSSKFEAEITKRINYVLHFHFDMQHFDSDACKEMRRHLYRVASQFHLQSKGFGISALDDVDIDKLMLRGFFTMPSFSAKGVNRVPISNYYIRKLFYHKITLDDGYQCWTLNDNGEKYMEIRRDNMKRVLSNQYRAAAYSRGVQCDFDSLADYALNYCGRVAVNDIKIMQLGDILDSPKLYVYASVADKNHFNMRFVTDKYLGYKDNYLDGFGNVMKLVDFEERFLFSQSILDRFEHYDDIIATLSKIDDSFVEKVNEYKRLHEDLPNRLALLF